MALRKHVLYISTAALTFCMAGYAVANPLVFQGQNAGLFSGANPSDTAQLMQSVPKPSTATSNASTQAISTSTLVLEALQSQISNQIYNAIFGTGAQPSGNANLGGGNLISWAHDGSGNIDITITAPDGTQTVVSFPDTSR